MPQSFDLQGPLSSLEPPKSRTAIESYYYPSNLTTVTNHYARFDASIFEDSRYQQGAAGPMSGPVDAGVGLIETIGALTAQLDPTFAGGTIRGAMALSPSIRNALQNRLARLQTGGTTSASLNYANAFGGQKFYNAFPGLRGIGNKKLLTHMYLYTPDTMTVGYRNNWDTISLREEFGVVADALSAGSDIGNGAPGSASILAAAAAAGAAGFAGAKAGLHRIQQMRGFPVNPMTETLYRDTNPRTFQFNFKFFPQTAKESEEIYNIVHQFAYHAAGEYATSEIGGFLIMPSVFDIKFMFLVRSPEGVTYEVENPWLRRISTCALTTIDIDQSPDGQWMAQQDGSPTSIMLALSFTELELMTKDRIVRGY
jgi:hypothetical protein